MHIIYYFVKKMWMIVTILDRVNSLKHYATSFVLLHATDSLQSEINNGTLFEGNVMQILC